jgi:spheroidene monooxygenase
LSLACFELEARRPTPFYQSGTQQKPGPNTEQGLMQAGEATESTLPVVTVSLFRYDGLAQKLWAFSRMGFARPMMKAIPGLTFWKLMGTGADAGFSTRPNFGVYTILCVWQNEAAAKAGLALQPFAGNRRHAVQSATFTMQTTQSRGDWAQSAPFGSAQLAAPTGSIVVALTRATIRLKHVRAFWKLVPAISDAIEEEDTRHFMIGMGEVPWLHQVTFSIWSDGDAMRRFSLTSPTHGTAVREAYAKGWFKDQLFARFNLISIDGAWPGLDDLPFLAELKNAEAAGHLSPTQPHLAQGALAA